MGAHVLAKKKFKLTECLDSIVDNRGKTPPLSETGVELLEVNAIIDGRKTPAFENVRKFVLEETYAKWFRSGHPRRGDTLISTVGAIGRVAYVENERGCIAQNIVSLRPKKDILDGEFLYYFLSSNEVQHRLLSLNIGVAQPSLKVPHLLSLEIELPSIPVQQRIAGILSAYDELIENSQQRIKILESMARALYREWFVYFRYPGHESVPLVPSSLGDVPQGWEAKELGQIAVNFDRLRKPLSKMQRVELQGEFPYYGAAKVFDYVNDYIFDGEYLLMAEDGSVITTDRNPVLQLVNEKFWPNNHTHVLRGESPVSTHFLYLGLSQVDISPYITGAAQPKITQENMNRIPFVCSTRRVHESFDLIVEPIIRESQLLQRQIQNLRATREALLPRLLSGQIDVDTIDV